VFHIPRVSRGLIRALRLHGDPIMRIEQIVTTCRETVVRFHEHAASLDFAGIFASEIVVEESLNLEKEESRWRRPRDTSGTRCFLAAGNADCQTVRKTVSRYRVPATWLQR